MRLLVFPYTIESTIGLLFGEQGANPLYTTFGSPINHYGSYGLYWDSYKAQQHVSFMIQTLERLIPLFMS